MTTFKKRFIAALSAGSMFLSLATPVLAEDTIIISGNGANTTNEAEVELDNDTNVVQNNNAQVYNNVSSNSSTGGNSASMNTGGEVLVSTGDATTDVSIENILNSNRALVDCCNQNDLDIEISDNGYESDNKVKMEADETDGSDINVYQDNYANVRNNVDADARTGHNDADYNTGGDVAVVTGDATTLVDVSTIANANWARVGSNGQGGEVSARIIGNGANTTNEIELELDDDILLVQDNNARISNDVDADAKTVSVDLNTGDSKQYTITDDVLGPASDLTQIEEGDQVTAISVDGDLRLLTKGPGAGFPFFGGMRGLGIGMGGRHGFGPGDWDGFKGDFEFDGELPDLMPRGGGGGGF